MLLVLAGAALRIVAAASWWPVATVLSDSGDYAQNAAGNPLASPQHPPGYSALLAVIGVFSHDVGVTIVLQFLAGILAALVMYATVRRLTGSPWPGLVPAAFILLNADEVFLEHTIMAEVWFVLALAAAFYAAVRAMDAPTPWWRWPSAAGALGGIATVIRSPALFLIPVIALALLVAAQCQWRERWRPPAAVLAVAGVLLCGLASANLISNGHFEISRASGWHLYGRVAPFADCREFSPPKGTERLCQNTPPNKRPAGDFYLYLPFSPAWKLWGPRPYVHHDSDMRAWAIRAILAQPGDYASSVWRDLRSWWVPSQR